MRYDRATTASLLVGLVSLTLCTASALGAEKVQGRLVTRETTTARVTPHGWVEEKIYLGQLDVGFGAGANTSHQPSGWFAIAGTADASGFPGGDYALFTLCYDGIAAFSFDLEKNVPGGGEVLDEQQLQTPAHYSVMYDRHWEEWGEDPWIGADDFYQTFVATSPHVTRIATKLADKSGDHYTMTLNFAVHEVSDGPPSTWKRISPVRQRFLSSGTDPIIHILRAPYQSQEVVLVPGKRYAVRLWRDPGSQSQEFSLVVRPDRGQGHRDGHLFVGDGARADFDAYLYVSGGEAGTVVNHAPVGAAELKDLAGSGKRFGQTFRATGVGLAGVDIIYTTGETRPPELPIRFQLYDKPGGRPVGPAKTCYGIPLAFQGRAAAIWRRGNAPLTAERTYYLEWSTNSCNTWRLNEDLPGDAYIDGVEKPGMDLAMSIAEYLDGKACTSTSSRPGR